MATRVHLMMNSVVCPSGCFSLDPGDASAGAKCWRCSSRLVNAVDCPGGDLTIFGATILEPREIPNEQQRIEDWLSDPRDSVGKVCFTHVARLARKCECSRFLYSPVDDDNGSCLSCGGPLRRVTFCKLCGDVLVHGWIIEGSRDADQR